MNAKRTKSLLLSAVLAFGAAGLVPTFAAAHERDREEVVHYREVPRAVRDTIDRERGRRDVKQIDHVYRNGREFFRVTIDERGNVDTVLRISESGRVFSEEQILDLGEERNVRFGSLPRGVRETIEIERGDHDLKSITEVRREDRTFFRVVIDTRRGDRMLRIGEGGKILEDVKIANVPTEVVVVRRGVDDDGERVGYDRLPRAVRIAIAREAGDDRVREVFRYERRWGTIYEVDLVDLRHSRVLRVNEDGRVLSDTDDAREERVAYRWDDIPVNVRTVFVKHFKTTEVVRVVRVTYEKKVYYRVWAEPKGRAGFWTTVDADGRHFDNFARL